MSLMPLGAALPASMMPAGRRREDVQHRASRARGKRGQMAAADHAAALGRAFSYSQGRARTDDELAALWEEYERRLTEGPDFMRVRSKAEFREAPPHQLCREKRARLRFLFLRVARGMWHGRRPGQHRGLIGRVDESLLGALLFLAERYPALFPSYERLATLARCARSSVATALGKLERLGWLTRIQRRARRKGQLGPEMVQATNAYLLHVPTKGLGAVALDLFGNVPESKNQPAIGPEYLSYLKDHPESWGSPGIARCDAHGEPPSAAHF